jgi:hypothetical protein
MSTWADMETTVVTTLAELIEGDAPLLATVAGHAAADRKSLIAAILGERLPAAYVIVEGREASERSSGRAGRAALSVLLAARSFRAGAEARTDGVDSMGVFTLAEIVADVLKDLEVIPAGRLRLLREEALPAQDGVALWEIAFAVRSVAELAVPTFGGAVLTGTYSSVRVDVGELRAASSSFSFPGIDGVFERRLGVRERPIWWRGELRGADAELNTIEADIENEVRAAQGKIMIDAYGRQLEDCVLKAFRRVGARGRDAVTGAALQEFEMEFTQLPG